jgi:hypothetical protein
MAGIFRPELLRVTLLGGLLGLGAHGGYHAVMTWLPTFLKTERNLGAELGRLPGGDHPGLLVRLRGQRPADRPHWAAQEHPAVRPVLRADRAGLCVLPADQYQMLFLGFPLGFFAAGIPASLGAFFNELYPADVRGAGVGFATTSAACCRRCSRSWSAT